MAVRTKAARARGRASEAGPARTRGRVPARPPHLAPGRPRLSRRGGFVIAVVSALVGALVALAVPALLDRPGRLGHLGTQLLEPRGGRPVRWPAVTGGDLVHDRQ